MKLGYRYLLSILTYFVFSSSSSLIEDSPADDLYIQYTEAYDSLKSIIERNGSFKTAVFIEENVFQGDSLQYSDFITQVYELVALTKMVKKSTEITQYRNNDDTDNYLVNYAIKSVLMDKLEIKQDSLKYYHLPAKYNFEDPLGNEDWRNMFVATFFEKNVGNCHSLSYLYKILADELGATCWLALAPNHIYIRNYSSKIGWYNTELTSGTFPTDAWVMTTGYVSPDAIRSGIYMDTLSNQQSIALCVLDLAKGYEFQTHNYYDGFILKCCDLALQYHPVNPMALLLKAETLKKVYRKTKEDKNLDASAIYAEMEGTYITLAKLGYREMPEKMYLQWIKNMNKQKDKYANEKVTNTTKGK